MIAPVSHGAQPKRPFLVRTRGFDEDYRIIARSRSAARYVSYLSYRDAGYGNDFMEFCRNTKVRPEAGR